MEQITHLSQLDITNGLYSYADYLTWKFDQTVEILRGKIFPMAGPSRRHQGISWKLSGLFYTTFKNQECRAYAAPFDVRLHDRTKSEKANKDIYTVVQPDICVICDLEKLDDKGCIGSPDLVIEILSPGNSSKEMKSKKQLYEECGVREYLIFDPERETVFQFHLTDDNVYSPATIYVSEETVTSVIFPELQMDLTEVFQAD
jgi:Uma2 family endonuclease